MILRRVQARLARVPCAHVRHASAAVPQPPNPPSSRSAASRARRLLASSSNQENLREGEGIRDHAIGRPHTDFHRSPTLNHGVAQPDAGYSSDAEAESEKKHAGARRDAEAEAPAADFHFDYRDDEKQHKAKGRKKKAKKKGKRRRQQVVEEPLSERSAPAPFRFEEAEDGSMTVPAADGFILTQPEDIVLRAPDSSGAPRVQEVKDTFRSMAPYIAAHRGQTTVIHVPGEAIDGQCANFPRLVQDIILMQVLGIKVVLVAGCRLQVNERLVLSGRDPMSIQDDFSASGIRRTDAFTLRCVREASSYARVYLESQVGRGLMDTPITTGLVQVSSGNFVSAKPYEGDVDFGYAGQVDKINTERINHLLGMGDVVLIGCLGYTPSGEVYNCASEQVAMETAVQLGAHKLIFLYGGHELYDRNTGGVVHSLPFSVGRAFLDLYRADQLELSAKADELCLKQSHEVRPFSEPSSAQTMTEWFCPQLTDLSVCLMWRSKRPRRRRSVGRPSCSRIWSWLCRPAHRACNAPTSSTARRTARFCWSSSRGMGAASWSRVTSTMGCGGRTWGTSARCCG